jgi:glycosyltransferase involved in cell wall biosynthesis
MSAPIVVLVTGRDPSHGMGGGSSYVRAHARAARLAGYDPHVFCLAPPADAGAAAAGAAPDLAATDFATIHRVPASLGPLGRWIGDGQPAERVLTHWFNSFAYSAYLVPFHAGRLAAAVERFLRGRPAPRLVHGFYTWGWVGLRLHRSAGGSGVVPIVSCFTLAADECSAKAAGAMAGGERWLSRAELLWARTAVAACERSTYRRSRQVLVNYDSVARQLTRRFGARLPLRKLPYASDLAFTRCRDAAAGPPGGAVASTAAAAGATDAAAVGPITAASAASRPRRIVAVSRHDPRKGHRVLLHALALLRRRGAAFQARLVSGGPLLAAHRELARQLALDDCVALPGWVDDPYAELRDADIFVLPSLQEGSGSIALLEALQAGLPIVASDVDGIGEDVVHGDSALLVPPDDHQALAAALGALLASPVLRRRLGDRARAAFEQRFTAPVFARALGEAYAAAGE